MDASLNEKVKVSIQNLRDKKSRIYFLVQDTKGNAKASVRLIQINSRSAYHRTSPYFLSTAYTSTT